MCIIIHKPKGKTVDLPTLKRCWDRNPHGAGFMFTNDGKVWGNKGYMSFDALLAGLHGAGFYRKGKLTGKYAVTIHFRLASHGGINQGNTHPFPMTDDLDIIKARYWEADCGMAHNGIIPIERQDTSISDTMTYILERMSNVYHRMDEADIYDLVAEETSGSRLFILYPDESYVLTGTWIEENGVLYSNAGFRQPKAAPRQSVYPPEGRRVLPMFQPNGMKSWIEEQQTKAGMPRKERPHAPPGMKWVTAK
jgi:hypothetical protein